MSETLAAVAVFLMLLLLFLSFLTMFVVGYYQGRRDAETELRGER